MEKGQVYSQTRTRAQKRQPIPIPFIKINGNIRFRREDISQWLKDLAEYQRTGIRPKVN